MAIVVLHQDFPIHCPCITDQSRLFVGACLARQGRPELSQILIDIDSFIRVFFFIDILQARPSAEDTLPNITCHKFNDYLAVLACSLAAHTLRDCDVPGLHWWVDLDGFTHTQDCSIGAIMLDKLGDATDSEAVSTTMLFKVVEFDLLVNNCLFEGKNFLVFLLQLVFQWLYLVMHPCWHQVFEVISIWCYNVLYHCLNIWAFASLN